MTANFFCKKFEETTTGTVQELLDYFGAQEVKGEIVIVVSGKPKEKLNED